MPIFNKLIIMEFLLVTKYERNIKWLRKRLSLASYYIAVGETDVTNKNPGQI